MYQGYSTKRDSHTEFVTSKTMTQQRLPDSEHEKYTNIIQFDQTLLSHDYDNATGTNNTKKLRDIQTLYQQPGFTPDRQLFLLWYVLHLYRRRRKKIRKSYTPVLKLFSRCNRQRRQRQQRIYLFLNCEGWQWKSYPWSEVVRDLAWWWRPVSAPKPVDYAVLVKTLPGGFPDSIGSKDNYPDGDVSDYDVIVDKNMIGVTLKRGESDDQNDFLDGNNGSTSWFVNDDNGNPCCFERSYNCFALPGRIPSWNCKNQPAFYVFNNVKPDNCTVVEKNPDGFPSSLSDHDNIPDGDQLVIVTPVWVTLFTTTWTWMKMMEMLLSLFLSMLWVPLWYSINFLKREKVDVNCNGSNGNTALIWATHHNNLNAIWGLLKHDRVDENAKSCAESWWKC